MRSSLRERILIAVLGWLAAFLLFFPILWMVLTSLKTEIEAIETPPAIFFTPTLENYVTVRERADYVHFAWNSVAISVGATLLAIVIAVPAAYAMAFFPGRRTKDLLLWMLSTKMMPAVGVLVPIYLICQERGCARHALGPDRGLHADEPADRGLDALHLLQGGAEGHPRGRADGRRQAQAGGLDAADAPVPARASPPPGCSRSSSAGTRPSGAST